MREGGRLPLPHTGDDALGPPEHGDLGEGGGITPRNKMPPSQNAQPSSKAVTPSSSIVKPQRPGSSAPGRLEDVQPRGLFD